MVNDKFKDDNFTQKIMDIEYYLHENYWLLSVVKLALEYGEEPHRAGVLSILRIMIKMAEKQSRNFEDLSFKICRLNER